MTPATRRALQASTTALNQLMALLRRSAAQAVRTAPTTRPTVVTAPLPGAADLVDDMTPAEWLRAHAEAKKAGLKWPYQRSAKYVGKELQARQEPHTQPPQHDQPAHPEPQYRPCPKCGGEMTNRTPEGGRYRGSIRCLACDHMMSGHHWRARNQSILHARR